MLTALLAVTLLKPSTMVDIPANASVWVYSHAGDPAHDQFLRVWGAGGIAISGGGPSDDWSYGYVGWSLADAPKGTPKSAELILHNVAPASLKPESEPLQARALKGEFSAETWNYSNANDVVPGPDAMVFGEGKATNLTDKPVEIRIKLNQKFLDYVGSLKSSHSIFMALTSKIDPNVEGAGSDKGGVYKIYSAAADAKLRPTLHIEY